jgi:hypothetical protein
MARCATPDVEHLIFEGEHSNREVADCFLHLFVNESTFSYPNVWKRQSVYDVKKRHPSPALPSIGRQAMLICFWAMQWIITTWATSIVLNELVQMKILVLISSNTVLSLIAERHVNNVPKWSEVDFERTLDFRSFQFHGSRMTVFRERSAVDARACIEMFTF